MQTKDYKHFWVLDSEVHCVSTTFCPYRSTLHIVWMRLCSKSVQLMVCTIFGMCGMQDTRFRNPHQVSLLALLKCKQWKAPRAGLTRFETAVIFSYKEAPIPLFLSACSPGISNPDNYHLWIPKGLEMIIEKHGGKPVGWLPHTCHWLQRIVCLFNK